MKSVVIKCDECGYYEEISLGNEAYFDKELFYNAPSTPLGEIWVDFILDEDILNKIDDLIINKQAMVDIDKIGHKLYYSVNEEKIYCLLYFCLVYIDNKGNMKRYIPRYKDESGNNLKLLTSKDVIVKCPKCDNKIKLC